MIMIMIYFTFKFVMTGSVATLKEEKKELSSILADILSIPFEIRHWHVKQSRCQKILEV